MEQQLNQMQIDTLIHDFLFESKLYLKSIEQNYYADENAQTEFKQQLAALDAFIKEPSLLAKMSDDPKQLTELGEAVYYADDRPNTDNLLYKENNVKFRQQFRKALYAVETYFHEVKRDKIEKKKSGSKTYEGAVERAIENMQKEIADFDKQLAGRKKKANLKSSFNRMLARIGFGNKQNSPRGSFLKESKSR